MTPTPQFFHSYNPCSSNRKIVVANGLVATVTRGLGTSLDLLRREMIFITLKPKSSRRKIYLSLLSSSNKDVVWLYHLRLGHLPFNILKLMFPQLFQGLDISKFHCDVCELAKHTCVPFPSNNKRSDHPFDLVHNDVWRPSIIPRPKLKKFRIGNARDYFSQMLSTYFTSQGIVHDSSRGEVVLIATYMINRLPIRILDNKSPIEVLNKFYPYFRTSNGLILRIFECTTFVHILKQHRDKLDPRAVKCIFLGYSPT
ncbi:hypothetical protein CR513_54342, partial [Mucuna pruriens]